jgi:glycosyltransferase involved in cell wall biosynthesis
MFDISVLAHAHRHDMARTGVFRATDNIVRRLAASNECTLSFCLAERVEETLDFLVDDPQLNNIGVALPRSKRLRERLFGKIHLLTDKLESNGSNASALKLKALRKNAYHLAQLAGRYGPLINKAALDRAEIYHSPFHAIPKQARAARNLKRFLTIYDLIPIMHPQVFESQMVAAMPRIINSLAPEDFALCISQCTKDDLCNYRRDLDPARVFVTHLAASDSFYPVSNEERLAAVRSKYHIGEQVPYLLSLGTLEPRKNIEHVVRCFAKVVREQNVRDLQLVLVGSSGWNYETIFHTIDTLDVPRDRIILTGYVDDEDLAPLYSGALGFIYLSLYEGFGLPPLEAMQCGVPVITSNRSSLPEVVGDAGLTIDPLDENAAAQKIFDIYRDSKLRTELSARSIERAREFSWDRCTRETLEAYKFALRN